MKNALLHMQNVTFTYLHHYLHQLTKHCSITFSTNYNKIQYQQI